MGFMINTRNMASIKSYAEALEHFDETKKPRSARWVENQRPLRDTRSTHLRLVQGVSNGLLYFELQLYSTPMIRYYQPADDGSRAIHITNHYSNSSQAFLWAHNWQGGKRLKLDTGEEWHMVLSNETRLAAALWGDHFTTRLVLRPDGTVDTKRSMHIPLFKRKSSSTLRAKRARFREALKVVFDLVELKYAQAVENAEVDERLGKPFRSSTRNNIYKMKRDLRQHLVGVDEISDDTMTHITHLCMEQVDSTVASIIAHRAWRYQRPDSMSYQEAMEAGAFVKDGEPLSEQSEYVREALTPTLEDVQRVMFNNLCEVACLQEADGRVPYPLFTKTAYRSYTSGLWAKPDTPLEQVLGEDIYHKLTSRKEVY
jgi:hypothetical protein